MHRAVLALTLVIASFLTAAGSLAQSTEQTDQQSNAHLYRGLFGVESVTEYLGHPIFPMFKEGSDCEVVCRRSIVCCAGSSKSIGEQAYDLFPSVSSVKEKKSSV